MVLRIITVDTFALAGASTIAAEELIELFAELLLGSGTYTQSQIDNMSWNEIETSVRNGVNDGTIDLSGTYYTDPESGALISFYEFLNSPAYVSAEAISVSALKDVVDSSVNSLIGTGLAGIYLHLSDLIKPSVIDDTGTVFDMKGYGCVIKRFTGEGKENFVDRFTI